MLVSFCCKPKLASKIKAAAGIDWISQSKLINDLLSLAFEVEEEER